MRAVFLVGPGRSGTTVTRQALARHPHVAALSREARFIVDPDGVLDLHDALTDHWDPFRADVALRRFIDCLDLGYFGRILRGQGVTVDFTTLRRGVGAVADGGRWVGSPPPGGMWRTVPSGGRATVALRRWVEDLYGQVNPVATHWVDDTPYGALHVRRLRELFPRAAVVMCVRHPLDILDSHLQRRDWASNNAETAAAVIAQVLQRRNNASWTMRLEDVLVDPARAMAQLCSALDLPADPASGMAEAYSADAANVGRRANLSPEARAAGVRVLGRACSMLRYDPHD